MTDKPKNPVEALAYAWASLDGVSEAGYGMYMEDASKIARLLNDSGYAIVKVEPATGFFRLGDRVEKHVGDYTGPGVIRGFIWKENGDIAPVVAHRLVGGAGELFHIYSERQIRLLTSEVEGTPV